MKFLNLVHNCVQLQQKMRGKNIDKIMGNDTVAEIMFYY